MSAGAKLGGWGGGDVAKVRKLAILRFLEKSWQINTYFDGLKRGD